jgi:hypothetical protein
MLRPTESKIIFIQQFGRGLRKAKTYGKKFVRVIDFIGNHKSFLEKPAALFNFDVDANSLGKFVQNYKNNKLNLPDESRVFYSPETINFFTKLSLKIKKEEFVKLPAGDLTKPLLPQIYKSFKKETVQKLFEYPKKGFKWNNMIGHIRPKNTKDEYAKEQFIFVILKKRDSEKDSLKYKDHFKSGKLFHWEAVEGTTENNKHGIAVMNHKKDNNKIHLFVKPHHILDNFVYCGEINFLSGGGNQPFSADFELEEPLTGDIKEEFLRISKLINNNI